MVMTLRHRARRSAPSRNASAAVDMHGAGPAFRDAAAEFRAGQADHVAQYPEKRRIGLDIDLPGCSVDFDCDHCGSAQSRVMPGRESA